MTIPIDLEADANRVPSSDQLGGVSALVEEYDYIAARIEKGEALLKALKERQQTIVNNDLPAAMASAGISAFKSASGRSVEVKNVCNGNIPAITTIEKTKDAAMRQALLSRRMSGISYVKEHWPGLVKAELSLSLAKGETEVALRIAELIRNQFKLSPSVAETIHPATLNSHFKELLETGRIGSVPVDLFALYIGPMATIK